MKTGHLKSDMSFHNFSKSYKYTVQHIFLTPILHTFYNILICTMVNPHTNPITLVVLLHFFTSTAILPKVGNKNQFGSDRLQHHEHKMDREY